MMFGEILFLAFLLVIALTMIFSYFGSTKAMIALIREPKHMKELFQVFRLKELKSAPTLILYLILVLGMFTSMTLIAIISKMSTPNVFWNTIVSLFGVLVIFQIGLIGLVMFVRKEYPAMFVLIDGRLIQFIGFVFMVSSVGLMLW